jgi:hypothetical protein
MVCEPMFPSDNDWVNFDGFPGHTGQKHDTSGDVDKQLLTVTSVWLGWGASVRLISAGKDLMHLCDPGPSAEAFLIEA